MSRATRRATAAIALTAAALAAAGCSGSGNGSASGPRHGSAAAAVHLLPRHILHAPRNLLSIAQPQADGSLWALAGGKSRGLYKIEPSGRVRRSLSVSGAAISVAESAGGVIALALGTANSGALELIGAKSAKRIKTVPLPAPARYVTAGTDRATFYVLTGWTHTASVTVIDARTGQVRKTVAVPADTVSVAADVRQSLLYVLERNGLVSELSTARSAPPTRFVVGKEAGRSLTLSPDGATLYVLKGTSTVANIAVVNVATQSVRRVLPAPSHCVQVLASGRGAQLYEAAGTASYGNIQIFSS